MRLERRPKQPGVDTVSPDGSHYLTSSGDPEKELKGREIPSILVF